MSVAFLDALAGDSLLDASVAVAVTFPTGIALVGVILATPSAPAVACPSSCPSLSNNLTVVPGSAFTTTSSVVFALPVKSV